MVTITLDQRVSRRARRAFELLDGVCVSAAPHTTLITDEGVAVLDVVEVGIEALGSVDAGAGASTLLLIAGVLSDQDAMRLEDAGQPFADAAGRAWVPGARRTPQRRTSGLVRVRAETLRTAQLLADHPDRPWSGGKLAHAADVSRRTAERLLDRLQAEGLVARSGHGRGSSTVVEDAGALRRWLLANGRQERHERVACFVRDPGALPAEVDEMRLVRSGAHGAGLLGIPVLSSASRPLLRVDLGTRDLQDVPALLGATRTTRGANVLLVADPGRLASTDARVVDGVSVAPPSRLALDMLLEPRGEAAADVFLDLWQNRGL